MEWTQDGDKHDFKAHGEGWRAHVWTIGCLSPMWLWQVEAGRVTMEGHVMGFGEEEAKRRAEVAVTHVPSLRESLMVKDAELEPAESQVVTKNDVPTAKVEEFWKDVYKASLKVSPRLAGAHHEECANDAVDAWERTKRRFDDAFLAELDAKRE